MVASGLEVVERHTPRAFIPSTANGLQSEAAYETLMGHPPPVDDSDEAWQWAYQGTTLEKIRLAIGVYGEPPEQLELFP